MSFLLQRQDRLEEALSYLREAFEVSASVVGEDHPDHLVLLINMGSLAARLERPDQAEAYFREAIERVTRTLGEDHPYFLPPVQSLGDLLVRQSRYSDAVELLSGSESACRRNAAIRDDGALARLLLNLGTARAETGAFAQAEANLVEAYTAFSMSHSPTSTRVRQCAEALVRLYSAWHAAEPEEGHDVKLTEWLRTREVATPPDPSSNDS
jgi:tetratricopeptide (TPR) repeat protein